MTRGERVEHAAPPAGSAVRREAVLVAAILIASLGLRLLLAAVVPVLAAEAYYWTWSRQLAWGYFDHPPAVALLVRAGTALIGDGPLGLRAGNLLVTTAALAIFWRFCRAVVGPRAALASLGVAAVAPFWMPFGAVTTPDGPLLACWVLALAAFWRARRGPALLPWLLVGATTGAALLSKYTAILLLPIFGAHLLLTPGGRNLLRRPAPWLGLALAGLVVAPNVLWTARHAATTVGMPFKDGVSPGDAPAQVGAFLLLPLLHLTPLLAWAWITQLRADLRGGRWLRDESRLLLMLASGLPLLGFLGVSVLTPIHAQWIAVAFVAAAPLALTNLDRDARSTITVGGPTRASLRRALWSGVACVALLATGAACLPLLARSGWAPAVRAAHEMSGWDALEQRMEEELARHLEEELARHGHPAPPLIAARDFHLVARSEWILGGRFTGLALSAHRSHQYQWWNDASLLGRDALLVRKFDPEEPPQDPAVYLNWFERAEKLPSVVVDVLGQPVTRFELFWCEDLRRMP